MAALPDVTDGRRGATTRPVYFSKEEGFVNAKVYERSELTPGFQAEGPAVIEEYGSTTLIAPNDSFEIGQLREIHVHCGGK